MSYVNISFGIIGVMLIFGIIVSAGFIEVENDPDITQSYIDSNLLPPNFDNFLVDLDKNVTEQIDAKFRDANVSSGIKQTAHWLTKSVTAGIYVDVYLGKAINEYMPWIGTWIKENTYLVFAGLIILTYPEIISLIIICIFAVIMILKEKFFGKKKRGPPEWRTIR